MLAAARDRSPGNLTRQGFKTVGIDASFEMLRYAAVNAPGAQFVCADVRRFRLARRFDAAVSLFDSLNHLLTLDDFESALTNVSRCLVSGGVFAFDLNTEIKYRTSWSGTWTTRDPETTTTATVSYREETPPGRVPRYDFIAGTGTVPPSFGCSRPGIPFPRLSMRSSGAVLRTFPVSPLSKIEGSKKRTAYYSSLECEFPVEFGECSKGCALTAGSGCGENGPNVHGPLIRLHGVGVAPFRDPPSPRLPCPLREDEYS